MKHIYIAIFVVAHFSISAHAGVNAGNSFAAVVEEPANVAEQPHDEKSAENGISEVSEHNAKVAEGDPIQKPLIHKASNPTVFCRDVVEEFIADQVGRSKGGVTVVSMTPKFSFIGQGSQYSVKYYLDNDSKKVKEIEFGVTSNPCTIH